MMSILIDVLWRDRVQSDWNQTDQYREDFIENKPTIPTVHPPVTIDPDSAGVASIDENQVLTITTSQNNTDYGIQSGGERVWIQNYDYTVLPAIYYINGVLYNSPQTDVTLAAADATNGRIDLFVLNTDSEVVVITGTPSENPSIPSLDAATQLSLGFVLVTANTTQPAGVTDELVYNENVEWTASAYGVLVDFESATLPKYGIVCADVDTIGNDDYLLFTAAAPVNFADYENIISYIKFKESLSTKESISVRFLLNGVGVSNQFEIPFVKSNLSWQAGVLPINMFTLYAETFDAVKFIWKTKGLIPSFHNGFYFDYVKLQLGVGLTIYNDTIVLTGDVAGTGKLGLPVPTTLATVNTDVGTFGDSTNAVTVTVDAKGRITAISESAIAANTDKVKYDASDPTAGYLAAKIIAGTGIAIEEGTGDDENKLVITNSVTLNSNYLKDWIEFEFRDITAGTAADYVLDLKALVGYTIDSAVMQVDTGTLTVAVKINTTAVTSLSAVAADTTITQTTATAANSVTAGDKVILAVSTAYTGAPTLMRGKLNLTRT